MKKSLFRLVLGVVIVDLVGIGVWYMAGGRQGDPARMRWVSGLWLVAVIAVVLPNLREIRRQRRQL